MNNRTGFFKNPEGLKQSGGEYLSIYLQNHKDIDICILALGTNDAQFFYNLDRKSAELGLMNLISAIREVNSDTKIVIVPPVKLLKIFCIVALLWCLILILLKNPRSFWGL